MLFNNLIIYTARPWQAPCLSGASAQKCAKHTALCAVGILRFCFACLLQNKCAKLGIAKMVLKKPQKCGGAFTDLQPYIKLKINKGLGWAFHFKPNLQLSKSEGIAALLAFSQPRVGKKKK